jgi:hemolysin activation/secretion protein
MASRHRLFGFGRATSLSFVFALAAGLCLAQEGVLVEKSRAQRTEGLAPATPASKPKLPAEEQTELNGDNTPLGVRFAAIRLVAKQDLTSPSPDIDGPENVRAGEGVFLPTGLAESLERTYIGQEITLARLQELTNGILTAYRASDYPLVDVYLPEQDITRGKIQLVVREAVLGQVIVEGATHSKPEKLIRQIRTAPGERINGRELEADLEWLNEVPGRRIDLIYSRGQADGTSDLVLKTEDQFPIQAYAGYANTGINQTGQTEWASGLIWNNILGSEHSASYGFSGDADLNNLNAHSLVYQVPLPWRHTIEVFGAYVLSSSNLDDPAFPLQVDGKSLQATGNYRIPLPRLRPNWRNELTLGTDYKSTNTDVLFGGDSFSDTTAVVFQLRLGYDLTVRDEWGATAFQINATVSPGGSVHGNNDEAFNLLREDSTADYFYTSATLERTVKLPKEFGLLFRAEGQYTEARLISTEQLLGGGYRTVRGFDENLARGDSGAVTTLQFMLPPLDVAPPFLGLGEDSLVFYAFQDSAFLYNNDPDFLDPDPSLHSLGFGMDYRLADHLSLRASYGWNVDDSGLGENIESGKFHFGVMLRY